MVNNYEDVDLMTPSEVATLWQVDPKTVTRWVFEGRIPADAVVRTLGGHRRYRRDKMMKLYRSQGK